MELMNRQVTIDRLIWDEWNRTHIARHAVLPEEAEAVMIGAPIFRESYKGRIAVTEPTMAGRILTVVVGPVPREPATYYVFSARPASRRVRREYRQ